MMEWIRVKDRLPEYNTYFIGYSKNSKYMDIVGYVGITWDELNYYNDFSHWMPLPEPPQ